MRIHAYFLDLHNFGRYLTIVEIFENCRGTAHEHYEAVPTIKPHARWHYEVARAFKMSYGRRVRGCSDRLGWLPETSHTSI